MVSPFICVLNILVGLFTHILIYLFIGLLYFHMERTHITYNQPILYKQFYTDFVVISHLFHTLKFSIWTMTTTWIYTRRVWKVCIGFYLQIPLYQRFHTFFGPFHTFFSYLQIFNMDHDDHLNKCYKTI